MIYMHFRLVLRFKARELHELWKAWNFGFLSENALPEYIPQLHNEIIPTLKNPEEINFVELEDKLYELLPENTETKR